MVTTVLLDFDSSDTVEPKNGKLAVARTICYAKTMSSSRGAKLILPYEQPTGSGLTSPFKRNLEIQRSAVLSQTPKKNEASATVY